ncbi:MAG: hypothetical protein RPU39_00375 [Candidatus Sedimenticola sp. (ex Thyasira tokunagai)]
MSKFQAICPACGAFGSPEIFMAEAVKREAIAKALRLPSPLALQVQTYIGLFRPPTRGHSMDRVDRLLQELLEPIEAGRIRRKGRDWPAPIEVWKYALDQVIEKRDTLRLPLKDHNYLFEVVAGQSNRLEGDAERKKEERLKHKPRDTGSSSLPPGYDAAKMAEQQMEAMRKNLKTKTAREKSQSSEALQASKDREARKKLEARIAKGDKP